MPGSSTSTSTRSIDKVVINGVDVTAYVNERDPWYPLRGMLRAPNPEGMRATWAALEEEWAKTITRAQALPEPALHESVDDEWCFVQTLRHLVLAMDKWFTAPILGKLPPDRFAEHRLRRLPVARPRVRPDAVCHGHARRARGSADALSRLSRIGPTSDLTRPVDVLENGTNPVHECIYTVFEEEFWHNRYALRDLALLDAARSA